MADPVLPPQEPSDSFWMTPQGQMVRVDPVSAEHLAKLPGFTPAPPEAVHQYFLEQEYGGAGQAAIAGLEGLGRGLSLDLSTPIERGLGVSAEGIASREMLHPLAGDIGYGLGVLAPLVGAPEAAAGKAAIEGAGEAAAGAGVRELTAPFQIARAGRGVSEAVKGAIAPTTAVGRIATDALAGAAGLGTEGAIYGLAPTIHDAAIDPDLSAEALLANGAKSVLETAALSGALGATGGLLSSATGLLRPRVADWLKQAEMDIYGRKLGVQKIEQAELVPEMAKRGLVGPFIPPETTNERAVEMLKDTGQAMESFANEATDAAMGKPKILGDGDKLLKELRQIADTMGEDDLKQVPAQKLRDYADALEQRWGDRFEQIRQEARMNGVKDSESEPFRNKITPRQLWQLRENIDDLIRGPKGNLDPDATWYRKGLHDFRWKVADELADSVDRAGLASKEWKGLNRDYHLASEAQKLSDRVLDLDVRRAGLSFTEKGAVALGLVHGTPGGMAGALAYAGLRQYGPDALAAGIRAMREGPGMAAPAVGAEAQGALQTIRSNTDRVLRGISSAVDKLVSSKITPHLVPPAIGETINQIDHVQRVASDAGLTQQWAGAHTDGLSQHAPNTAVAAQAAMSRALSYLAQTAPTGRPPSGLVPAAPPSKADLASWHQRMETVKDPVGVLSKGVLSQEVLDTLKAVYPRLYGEVQAKLLEQVTLNPEIPYQRGLQLSKLAGVPLYPSQAPAAVLANHASSAPAAPQASMVPPPPPSRSTSRSGASARVSNPLTALGSLYRLR
jgi:hypothetical protein